MWYCLLCGFFGALASVIGKMSLSYNNIMDGVNSACSNQLSSSWCLFVAFFVRFILFCAMLGLNLSMVTYFLKALEKNASVVVTVVSSATNYLLVGILGRVLFSEQLNTQWVVGSVLICCGLCFVGVSQEGFPKLREK
jgi:uncharacterized membrane protein